MTPGSAVVERVRLRAHVRHCLVLVHDVLDRHRPSGLERSLQIGQSSRASYPRSAACASVVAKTTRSIPASSAAAWHIGHGSVLATRRHRRGEPYRGAVLRP